MGCAEGKKVMSLLFGVLTVGLFFLMVAVVGWRLMIGHGVRVHWRQANEFELFELSILVGFLMALLFFFVWLMENRNGLALSFFWSLAIIFITGASYFPKCSPEIIWQNHRLAAEKMWVRPLSWIRAVPLVYRVEEKTASGIKVNLVFRPEREQALKYDQGEVRKDLRRFIRGQKDPLVEFSQEEIDNLRASLRRLPENLVGEISGTVTFTTPL